MINRDNEFFIESNFSTVTKGDLVIDYSCIHCDVTNTEVFTEDHVKVQILPFNDGYVESLVYVRSICKKCKTRNRPLIQRLRVER